MYDITVNVANKGIAKMNTAVQYEYQLSIDSFTPTSGGTGGKEKSRERIIIKKYHYHFIL